MVADDPVHRHPETIEEFDSLPRIMGGIVAMARPVVEPVAHEYHRITLLLANFPTKPCDEIQAIEIVALAVILTTEMDIGEHSSFVKEWTHPTTTTPIKTEINLLRVLVCSVD
jgi:hypothetical protein